MDPRHGGDGGDRRGGFEVECRAWGPLAPPRSVHPEGTPSLGEFQESLCWTVIRASQRCLVGEPRQSHPFVSQPRS